MGSINPSKSEHPELQVSGPLRLCADEPESLTWLARTGSYVVGWVRLCRAQQHVGLLRELHLSDSVRNPMAVATRLCSALYDYARDHGLLKLKLHRDCMHECLHTALYHAGFSHDEHGHAGHATQVYVDLYRCPHSRSHPRAHERGHEHGESHTGAADGPQAGGIRMAS